jgi:hypothetical protein
MAPRRVNMTIFSRSSRFGGTDWYRIALAGGKWIMKFLKY